ncbi:MAG: hypothetical protein FWG83_06200 [Oscillospiraceae bacterium]|nr:hypothetical protein [Oscillospiraceae bacterium]
MMEDKKINVQEKPEKSKDGFFSKIRRVYDSFSSYELFLLGAVVFLFIWLIQYNIVTAYTAMDSDVVVDNILIPKIVSERGLFFNDFIFGHESMFSRPFIVTLVMKLFISDWIMAAKVGILFTTLAILVLWYILCRRINFSRSAAFISMIFLLGANVSIFNNFRGANFYPTFVMLPLLTCILLIDMKKNSYALKGKKNIIRAISLVLLSFIGGIFGIRMMAVLYIPLLAVEFFNAIGEARNDPERESKVLKPFLRLRGLITAAVLFLVNGAGMALLSLYNRYAGAYVPAATNIQSVERIFDEILPAAGRSLLQSLVVHAGGMGSKDPAFVKTMGETFLRLFVIGLVVFVVFSIIKNRKAKLKEEGVIFASEYFAAAFALVFCITVVIGQASPKYYYFNWYLLAFGVACLTSRNVISTVLLRRGVALLIAVLCVFSIYNHDLKALEDGRERNKETLTHYKAAQYLNRNGYECIYGGFWNVALTASYANMEIDAGYLNADSFRAEFWAADKRVYFDNNKGKYALVLTESEWSTMTTVTPKYKRDFLASEAVFVTRIDNLVIYEVGINPLPAFRVPNFKGESAVYDFSMNYAAKNDAAYVSFKENYVDSNQMNGMMVWGPHITLLKGEYELTLKYAELGDNTGGAAKFSVTSNFGGKTLVSQPMSSSGTLKVTMTVEETAENVEFKVDVNHDRPIRLYTLEVTKM